MNSQTIYNIPEINNMIHSYIKDKNIKIKKQLEKIKRRTITSQEYFGDEWCETDEDFERFKKQSGLIVEWSKYLFTDFFGRQSYKIYCRFEICMKCGGYIISDHCSDNAWCSCKNVDVHRTSI